MAGLIGRIVGTWGARSRDVAGLGLLVMVGLVAAAGAETLSPSGTVAPSGPPRAVVELFTSQGCSSCPPADKLLSEMAERRRDIVALTLAVDYWDYLGWKDTLAKHGHSVRQKAYARLRGDGKMFTPQVVVNGSGMAVGSDAQALEAALEATPAPLVPVTLGVREGRLSVGVGAGAAAGEVWLCPVASSVTVAIGRGENEGAQMTYHNVVRRWIKLGDWSGAAASFETPVAGFAGETIDSVAVLVQAGSQSAPGAILGASLMRLPKDTAATPPPAGGTVQ